MKNIQLVIAAALAAVLAGCNCGQTNKPLPGQDAGKGDAGCISATDCPGGTCQGGKCVYPDGGGGDGGGHDGGGTDGGPDGGTPPCSPQNPNGTCATVGDRCINGTCTPACSPTAPTGYCVIASEQCVNGTCKAACSPTVPGGYCTNANEKCLSGACTGPCGPGVPNGWCANATDVCFQGACTDASTVPCAQGGSQCPADQTCVAQSCLDNCGAGHPSGYCPPPQQCLSGGCVTPATPVAGDLVIDEILVNAPGADDGEYFEVLVTAATPVELGGCVLSSNAGAETFTIPGSLVVKPGDYVTFAKSSDPVVMGFTPTLSYNAKLTFSNGNADDATVSCGGSQVATMSWNGSSGFSVTTDTALELSITHLNATDAASPSFWCLGTTTFTQAAGPAKGTPGVVNTCRSACGPTEPNGVCTNPTDRCIGGACTPPCSASATSGYCPNAGEVCQDGNCPCSPQTPAGYCLAAGDVCYQNACTPKASVPCADGGDVCPASQTCVAKVCQDNCDATHPTGYCPPTTACDGLTCVTTCAAGGTYCPTPLDHCISSVCTPPCSSTATSGYCPNAGEVCQSGNCPCSPQTPAGYCTTAGDFCYGNVCVPASGVPCALGGTQCPVDQTCVSLACKNNCNIEPGTGYCAPPTVCDPAGACQLPCASGGTWCPSPGDLCVGTLCVTPCGVGAGTYCPNAGDVCYTGTCQPAGTVPCASGGTQCPANQTCVASNCRNNCSIEPTTGYCPTPQVCDGTGTCQTPCGSGGTWCPTAGDLCYQNACTPPAQVPCASGGTQCPANQTCSASVCQDNCAPTFPDGYCPNSGDRCYAGACTAACAAGLNGWCPTATDTCDSTAGTCGPAAVPAAGDLVVSEVLVDAPSVAGASEIGELVEFFNRSTKVVNLKTCNLRSGSGASGTENTAAFAADIPVAPYHFVVFTKAATGMTFDYTPAATYGTIAFSNSSADYVALICATVAVDGVSWTGSTSGYPSIGAFTADTTSERSTATLITGTPGWCGGTVSHTITNSTGGTGTFKGTPGKANSCP